jgi:hypothetical protein
MQISSRPSRPLQLLAVIALAIICWWAFLLGLDIPGPVDKIEALQMEIARRMALEGDWITPVWNGSPYFDKPVWPYWLGGLGFRGRSRPAPGWRCCSASPPARPLTGGGAGPASLGPGPAGGLDPRAQRGLVGLGAHRSP